VVIFVNGLPLGVIELAAFPAYDAAIRVADLANIRAILASAALNGLDGPRQTLHDLTGSWV